MRGRPRGTRRTGRGASSAASDAAGGEGSSSAGGALRKNGDGPRPPLRARAAGRLRECQAKQGCSPKPAGSALAAASSASSAELISMRVSTSVSGRKRGSLRSGRSGRGGARLKAAILPVVVWLCSEFVAILVRNSCCGSVLRRSLPASIGLCGSRRCSPLVIRVLRDYGRQIRAPARHSAAARPLRVLQALRLVDGADDAEIMLGVLVIRLAGHAVAIAESIAGKLLIFIIELLGGAAHPHFRTGTVEHMVAVERNAVLLVAKPAATTAATTVRAMVATTHALHVHCFSSILVRLLCAAGCVCTARPKLVSSQRRDSRPIQPAITCLTRYSRIMPMAYL